MSIQPDVGIVHFNNYKKITVNEKSENTPGALSELRIILLHYRCQKYPQHLKLDKNTLVTLNESRIFRVISSSQNYLKEVKKISPLILKQLKILSVP